MKNSSLSHVSNGRIVNWFFTIFFVLFVFSSNSSDAVAAGLEQPDNKRWLTVASTKDIDTAIAISGVYSSERAKVVSSQSGWFAVVLGPYEEGTLEAVRKAHPEIGDIPKDALLSRGDKYIEILHEEKNWQDSRLLAEYLANKPVQFAANDMTFSVSMQGTEDDPGATTAKATRNGATVFSFSTPNEYVQFGAEAGLLNLDATAGSPQLVFTRYTGGAHCCTQTWIATAPQGAAGWSLIDAGVLDGGAYSFDDIDGDGALELFNVDNNFLYAFDSYAGSFAPIRISQLRGNQLNDISNAEISRRYLRRDLARMEFVAKLDPSLWKTNGYLAGWLAAKQRLGQGEEAWQTALENLDANSDFGPQICKTGKPIEQCPFDDLERIPVAKALAQFLAERDYGELPTVARALLP